MNIAAIRAYSQASGVRPSLPTRHKSAVTDGFDIENASQRQAGQKTAGKVTSDFLRDVTQNDEPTERFALFNKAAQVESFAVEKGKLFDGRA